MNPPPYHIQQERPSTPDVLTTSVRPSSSDDTTGTTEALRRHTTRRMGNCDSSNPTTWSKQQEEGGGREILPWQVQMVPLAETPPYYRARSGAEHLLSASENMGSICESPPPTTPCCTCETISVFVDTPPLTYLEVL